MAYRRCKRVRRVIGTGRFLESQEELDQLLNLSLLSPSLPHDGLFDRLGRILVIGHTELGEGEQYHSPRLRNRYGARGIPRKVEAFNTRLSRPVCFYDAFDFQTELQKPFPDGLSGSRCDHTVGNMPIAGPGDFHNTPSRGGETGINPKDPAHSSISKSSGISMLLDTS